MQLYAVLNKGKLSSIGVILFQTFHKLIPLIVCICQWGTEKPAQSQEEKKNVQKEMWHSKLKKKYAWSVSTRGREKFCSDKHCIFHNKQMDNKCHLDTYTHAHRYT